MKKLRILLPLLLGVVLVLSLALAGCPAEEQPPVPEVPTDAEVVADAAMIYFAVLPDDKELIREDAFVERVKAGEDMFILDIRRAEDFAAGHVIGAVSLPWGTAIGDNLDRLPADETIYLYCYTGQTAGQVVALLNVAGFDAKSVRFGYVRGIVTIENHEDIIGTIPADWPEVTKLEIEPAVEAAIRDYFVALADVAGTEVASNIISAENANKVLNDPDTIFLSVRKADDYAAKHIPGAINIPYSRGMQVELAELPTDKRIIVYCYSGQTSGQTVAILRLLGYDAISLNSGMGVAKTGPRGWANEG
ncbi:rhodanese-like domain-containing protein, partial [Dehalococcoidia bacterium]|nr:rhodanese-like domain-containing protein [Dehalococcoidia bacterium]